MVEKGYMKLPKGSLVHREKFSGDLTGKEKFIVKVLAYIRKSIMLLTIMMLKGLVRFW